jgi:hypothetical protein
MYAKHMLSITLLNGHELQKREGLHKNERVIKIGSKTGPRKLKLGTITGKWKLSHWCPPPPPNKNCGCEFFV